MDKRRLSLIFIFLIIVLFVFTFNVTSSRYMGQIESEANDVIAIPVIDITNPTFEYTPADLIPGFIGESDFYVRNYDDTNTNEVLMKYYLKVQVISDIPIKISLTDENGQAIILDNEQKTAEKELPYGEKAQTKYHIKIEWDKKDNDYQYAGKSMKLIIDLTSTQVVEES